MRLTGLNNFLGSQRVDGSNSGLPDYMPIFFLLGNSPLQKKDQGSIEITMPHTLILSMEDSVHFHNPEV